MIDIKQTHPEYNTNIGKWKKLRNTVSGEDDIKKEGEIYLPKPSGMNTTEYDAYKTRAMFYGGTGRTIEGMTGLMFRIPVMYNDKDVSNYGGLFGTTYGDIVHMAAYEVLVTGRCGVLVDYPEVDTNGMTMSELQAANIHPYAVVYKAEDIINWEVDQKGILTDVVLQYQVIEDGEFITERKHLTIDESGTYNVITFRPSKNSVNNETEYVEVSRTTPLMNGSTMNRIPFVFINTNTLSATVTKPPLLDLANVNISMYRNSADYEHGLHWVGLPTPIFKGAGDAELRIGSATGINLPENGDAFMLEFTGQGLAQLNDSMVNKRSDMATLGSRMLATEKKAVESAETAAIHRAGEAATLQTIANNVSRGMTIVLQIIVEWDGVEGAEDYTVTINTDYNPAKIDAQTITALFQAVQGGRLAQEDFINALQNGELVDRDRDPQEIMQESQDELEMTGSNIIQDTGFNAFS
jgi:hypothetical protein